MQKPEWDSLTKMVNSERKMAKKEYELCTSAFYDLKNEKAKIAETDEVRESIGQRPAGHAILFYCRARGPR